MGSLERKLRAVSSPLSSLFIAVQASEVLNPQEKEGSLLISKAATSVERVAGGGNSRRALLVKQRPWLGTGEEDAGSWW